MHDQLSDLQQQLKGVSEGQSELGQQVAALKASARKESNPRFSAAGSSIDSSPAASTEAAASSPAPAIGPVGQQQAQSDVAGQQSVASGNPHETGFGQRLDGLAAEVGLPRIINQACKQCNALLVHTYWLNGTEL